MIKVEVIIAPEFVVTELAAMMDVFRIANRLSVRPGLNHVSTTGADPSIQQSTHRQ